MAHILQLLPPDLKSVNLSYLKLKFSKAPWFSKQSVKQMPCFVLFEFAIWWEIHAAFWTEVNFWRRYYFWNGFGKYFIFTTHNNNILTFNIVKAETVSILLYWQALHFFYCEMNLKNDFQGIGNLMFVNLELKLY